MKIKKFEYETLVRDSEKVAILTEIRRRKMKVSDELLDVFCELQSDENIAPEEVVEESTENSNEKTVGQLYEDFLDENYEPDKESPSESTPPKNIPPAVWVAVPQGKRESIKEK